MTKTEFIKRISEDTEISRSDVRKVIDSMEDLVMEIIALEDNIQFSFGKIEGYTKPPWKITGAYSGMKIFKRNACWSDAKTGFPKMTFSKAARDYLAMEPKKYFDMPEHRYTTNARRFRQDNDLEEIPEYQGLSEEKILELCRRADKIEKGADKSKFKEREFRANERRLLNERKKEEAKLIYEDIKRQLNEGIPMADVVIRTKEELLKDYQEREDRNQANFAVRNPWLERDRQKEMRNRQYVD